jgi:hypothetical protein
LSGLVFNRSAYAPHGDGSKRLPAHPLIHVVQQVRPDMAIQRAPSADAGPIGRRFQTLRSPQHLDRTLPRTSWRPPPLLPS